jgi:hypothetical protein
MGHPAIALRLLRRQSEPEEAMPRPRGIGVPEVRELDPLTDRLPKGPAAVRAVADASRRLHRPVDAPSELDIETIGAARHRYRGTAK